MSICYAPSPASRPNNLVTTAQNRKDAFVISAEATAKTFRRREVALNAWAAPYCRGLHFLIRKLRPATASLQYQNGPARVLLRHLKPARLLVGCVGPRGRDTGATAGIRERSGVK